MTLTFKFYADNESGDSKTFKKVCNDYGVKKKITRI